MGEKLEDIALCLIANERPEDTSIRASNGYSVENDNAYGGNADLFVGDQGVPYTVGLAPSGEA